MQTLPACSGAEAHPDIFTVRRRYGGFSLPCPCKHFIFDVFRLDIITSTTHHRASQHFARGACTLWLTRCGLYGLPAIQLPGWGALYACLPFTCVIGLVCTLEGKQTRCVRAPTRFPSCFTVCGETLGARRLVMFVCELHGNMYQSYVLKGNPLRASRSKSCAFASGTCCAFASGTPPCSRISKTKSEKWLGWRLCGKQILLRRSAATATWATNLGEGHEHFGRASGAHHGEGHRRSARTSQKHR